MKDPYTILGLNQQASQAEIKQAYLKLAKKYHPDLNPGNQEAEKKFKEAAHAFDLIGTPEARAKFDRGETSDESTGAGFGGQGPGGYYYQSQDGGGRYTHSFGEDFADEDLFEQLFGGRRRGAAGARGRMAGKDEIYQMEVGFVEAALGAEKEVTLPTGKKLKLNIPAGVETGQKLRLKGQGRPGQGGAPAGDAYVEVRVKELIGFTRKGADIETELPLSFLDAITGAEVEVPTLEGKVLMKVPPGTSSGSKLRIKGKGAGAEGQRGDLLAVIKVVVPKHPDPELKQSIEGLRDQYGFDPRRAT